MTIEREPHRLASAFWAGWMISTPGVALFGGVTAWAVWLVAFMAVEFPAALIDTGRRDTFSEVFTWTQRKLSKHMKFGRGWNALLLMLIEFIATTATLPMWLTWRHVMLPIQAVIVFTLTSIWLYDHLFDPVGNG